MAENPNVGNTGKDTDKTGSSLPDDIEKTARKADDAVDNLLDRASDAVHSAEDAVANAGGAVAEAGSKLLHGAGEMVDKASDAVADAGSSIAEGAGILVDDAGNAINNAGQTIANAGESAYKTGAKLVDSAGNVIHGAENAVSEAGTKLVDGAGNVIHNAGAAAGSVAAGTGIAAAKAGAAAKKATATAINKTGHALDETSKSAQRAAAKAARDAKTLSDKVADRADNIKWLVLALLVLLLAAAAIYSYMTKASAKRSADAQNLVFKSAMEMQGKPEADAIATFDKAAKDFKGLTAGQQARLYQFAYGFNTGKFAEAEQSAREFLKDYPKSAMANRASLALGQALMQQDNKLDDAIATFRDLVAKNDPETIAEAKLALAQALEKNAEKVKDQPEEYRRRLELAEQEYTDILSRANISIPSQRGYWPQAVTLPADYALVQIKDKLAGHQHGIPSSMEVSAPVSQRDLEGAGAILPPSAGAAGEGGGLGIAAPGSDKDEMGVAAAIAAAAAAAAEKALSAKDAVTDAIAGTADKAMGLIEGDGASASASGESIADKAREMMERAINKEKMESAAGLTQGSSTGSPASGEESLAEKARKMMERAISKEQLESAATGLTQGISTGSPVAGEESLAEKARKMMERAISKEQLESAAAGLTQSIPAGSPASGEESLAEKARKMMERAINKEQLESAATGLTQGISTGSPAAGEESLAEKARKMMERAITNAARTEGQLDDAARSAIEGAASTAGGVIERTISVMTDADHTGEEYVKASEAGMGSSPVRTEVSLPLQTQVIEAPTVVVTETAIPTSGAVSTPDTIVVTENVDHEGEEYVKASEAGMAPAGHLVITSEMGQQVEIVSEDPVHQ